MGLPRPTGQGNLLLSVVDLVDELERRGLDLRIDFGAGAAVWSSSQFSATAPVSHKLHKIPRYWAAFCSDAGQVIYFFTGVAPTATTLTFQGAATASMSGTRNFVWIAVG